MRIPALLAFRGAAFFSRLWGTGFAQGSLGHEWGVERARGGAGLEEGGCSSLPSRFPTTLNGEVVPSPFHRESRFDSKRAGDLSKVTQLLQKFAGLWSSKPGWAEADPGNLLLPRPALVAHGDRPPRPLDGSLGLRRAARKGSAGAVATLWRVKPVAPRAAPGEALPLAPKPEMIGSK